MAPYWFFPLFAGFLILESLISAAVTAVLRRRRQKQAERQFQYTPRSWDWPTPPHLWDPAREESATTDHRPGRPSAIEPLVRRVPGHKRPAND